MCWQMQKEEQCSWLCVSVYFKSNGQNIEENLESDNQKQCRNMKYARKLSVKEDFFFLIALNES